MKLKGVHENANVIDPLWPSKLSIYLCHSPLKNFHQNLKRQYSSTLFFVGVRGGRGEMIHRFSIITGTQHMVQG